LVSFLIAFFVSIVLTPSVIRFASNRKLFDKPDDRKIHGTDIPRLGGVAILGAFLIGIFLTADPDTIFGIRFFLAGLLILFFVGLWDDLQPIKPLFKLIGELVPIALLSWSHQIPFHDLLPDYPVLMGLDLPFTFFVSFWIINSFNLIDGINGLAGTVGLLALLASAWYCNSLIIPQTVCLAMAGAILAFLFFNFIHPRIFMGDSGSLLIGYCMTFVLTCVQWPVYTEVKSVYAAYFTDIFPWIALPVFDMARVFVIRVYKKKNPFQGDRNHLHHLLLECGLSHIGATSVLAALTVVTAIACFGTVGFVEGLLSSDSTFTAPHVFKNTVLIAMISTIAILQLIFAGVIWRKVRKVRRLIVNVL
jgi:UDP-GlcNAc:undecaprenyl-phosphate GlcNAc-1-phosphate transferase